MFNSNLYILYVCVARVCESVCTCVYSYQHFLYYNYRLITNKKIICKPHNLCYHPFCHLFPALCHTFFFLF